MPVDEKAKKFLGPGPIKEIPGQESKEASVRLASYRQREFRERAGAFAEDLVAFFVQQRKKHGFLDDECVGAVALFTINLRESYGSPQNDEEKKEWTEALRAQRLEEFDAICGEMQLYFDENA
jgi:hypothetical protein